MNSINDISYTHLGLSILLIGLPILLLVWFKIKLFTSIVISVLRMMLQLSLVALYLEFVFAWNNTWLNISWVALMILIGALTTIKRSKLQWRLLLLPLLVSGFTSILIVDTFFLGFILKLDNVFDARYFIPITGMILGNALNHNIVGINSYFYSLKEKRDLYNFLLSNTASHRKAQLPFIQEAVQKALQPMIATMSVIGLISLPGMMTGQILGGSAPAIAIKYQIMIMLAIFIGCSLNLLFSIMLSNHFIFDKYNNLKTEHIFK